MSAVTKSSVRHIGNSDEQGIAGKVGDYAGEVADQVKKTASEYASTAGSYAETLMHSSERLAQQTHSGLSQTVSNVVQQQPLAVAIAGLMAGAAVAAVFPATDIERQTLGPAGEGLAEAASDFGDRLGKAAGAATDRLKEEVTDRGLNAEGLKDVASNVAEAFTGAVADASNTSGSQTVDPTRGYAERKQSL